MFSNRYKPIFAVYIYLIFVLYNEQTLYYKERGLLDLMKTRILKPDCEADIAFAGEALRNGELICIPTETVYGLAADALNPEAVSNIFVVKGRPNDNPLIVHIADFDDIYPLVKYVPEEAKKLAEKFWPGPLTMVLPKSDLVPMRTSGGLQTVAIRFPSHPTAQAIIKATGKPLAAPSANLSGKPSPTEFKYCLEDLDGKIVGIVDGGDCAVGVESTVLTLAEGTPRVLRPGGITVEMLRTVLDEVIVDDAVIHGLAKDAKASSPGMKYKHYSPKADITIADMSLEDYVSLMKNNPDCGALCFDGEEKYFNNKSVSFGKEYDGESQAQRLFAALNELDEKGINKVYSRRVQKHEVGLAVFNRLVRSAGFNIIHSDFNIIGLTGMTGSGKSYVADFFRKQGIPVIDCDAVTKIPNLYNANDFVPVFGEEVKNSDGTLNRRKLAEIAFSTEGGKQKLEEITFPIILSKIEEMISQVKLEGNKVVVLDAPTLFDCGLQDKCSRIVVVTADEKIRLERIIKRDNITEEQAKLRMNAQHDLTHFADVVINTNTTRDLTEEIKAILEDLK